MRPLPGNIQESFGWIRTVVLGAKSDAIATKSFSRNVRNRHSEPYGYLLIDGRQTTPPSARFRTNIFDDNGIQHVFVLSSDRDGEDDQKKQNY